MKLTLAILMLNSSLALGAEKFDAFYLRFLREAALNSFTPEMRNVFLNLTPENRRFLGWPPNAAFELGLIYRLGEDGIPQNDAEAFKWFSHAAGQGHTNALSEGGNMLLQGRGTAKNYRTGEAWLTDAATKGDAGAQFMLGCLFSGAVADVPWQKNLVEGNKWLLAAKANGHTRAAIHLEVNNESMTPNQITEAQRRAEAFAPKDSTARWRAPVPRMPPDLNASPPEPTKADPEAMKRAEEARKRFTEEQRVKLAGADVKLLAFQRKRATDGEASAQFDLGLRYLTGKGVEKSDSEARVWLQKAAAQGHAKAKAKLAEIAR